MDGKTHKMWWRESREQMFAWDLMFQGESLKFPLAQVIQIPENDGTFYLKCPLLAIYKQLLDAFTAQEAREEAVQRLCAAATDQYGQMIVIIGLLKTTKNEVEPKEENQDGHTHNMPGLRGQPRPRRKMRLPKGQNHTGRHRRKV